MDPSNFIERTEAFLRSRRNLYEMDDEFVKDIFGSPSTDQTKVAVIIRRQIGDSCGVAPEKLKSDDRIEEIATLVHPTGCLLMGARTLDPVYIASQHLSDKLSHLTGTGIKMENEILRAPFTFFRHPDFAARRGETLGSWIKNATQEFLEQLSRQGLKI